MSEHGMMTAEKVVDFLLSGEEKSVVLLFDDSRKMRLFSDVLGERVRSDPRFQMTNTTAFRVSRNNVRVKDTNVFLGLKKDEPLLSGKYDGEQIQYYDEAKREER